MSSRQGFNLVFALGTVGSITGLLHGSCGSDAGPLIAPISADLSPGGIYTTTAAGHTIHSNTYPFREGVYLHGGPGPNASTAARGLTEGDYYFQVTDPSGLNLLSTEHISCRRFHVNAAGVIDHLYPGLNYVRSEGRWVPTPCGHAIGADLERGSLGAVGAQLAPYDPSPDLAQIYKVWVIRTDDFRGAMGYVPRQPEDTPHGEDNLAGTYHGFVAERSKTEQFRVIHAGMTPSDPPLLAIRTFHDRNMNGRRDAAEALFAEWGVVIQDPLGARNTLNTPAFALVTRGTWTTMEEARERTVQTVSFLDGTRMSLFPNASRIVSVAVAGSDRERHDVVYGNVALGSVTACKIYDRNANGSVDSDEPRVVGWPMVLQGSDLLAESIGPNMQRTGDDGCTTFAAVRPGSYTLSEAEASREWVRTGAISYSYTIESSLQNAELVGTSVRAEFTNLCVGSVAFGSKGYWHNRNGLSEITANDIGYVNSLAPYASPSTYFDHGDEPFDGRFSDGSLVPAVSGASGERVAPVGSALAEISRFLVDANDGGDPREQLAQQLLAFVFNTRHRLDASQSLLVMADGSYRAGVQIVDDAVRAWSSTSAADQRAAAALLEGFNTTQSVRFVRWNPCAVPQD